MASKLSREILQALHERTGKALPTLRSEISRIRQIHPTLTSNAAAHLIAQKHGTSVLQKLDLEDKESLKGISITSKANNPVEIKVAQKVKTSPDKNHSKPIVNYDSDNYLALVHKSKSRRNPLGRLQSYATLQL